MAYIVGICGVRGAGKSTLARSLGVTLKADVVSTGRTRDMVRVHHEREQFPDLFESITNADSLEKARQYLTAQSALLKPYIQAVVDRCRGSNAHLIVEGTHVQPGFYNMESDFGTTADEANFDLQVLLVASEERLRHRF